MARRLTKKQRGFVKDYVKTGVGVTAALKNYDTTDYDTAHAIATENLQKPSILKSIQEMLPDDLLAERHLELLNKREQRVVGEELLEVGPDVQAVSKGLDMAYKIKGNYAPEKSVNLNIDAAPSDRIKELARKLKEADK